jgi:ferredoxin-NADP reductase
VSGERGWQIAGGDLGWRVATIESVQVRTPRLKSIFLRTELDGQLAGQHVDLRLTADDGYQARRSYSIASAPGSALVELAIERLDDGEVSPYFHDVAEPGDSIELLGPIGGHFVWRPEDAGPLLLVAGGSGVVPLLAMLRQRAQFAELGPDVPALLLYSAREWNELAFAEELQGYEAADPSLRIRFVTTRGPGQRAQDLTQRLDATSLAQQLDQWGQVPRAVYVCGATRFVETIADGLVRCGIEPGAIRTERYGGVA